MKSIIARNLVELERAHGSWGIKRLRELLIEDANTYVIEKELGLSKCVIGFLRSNLPLLLRTIEPKKQELRLVYYQRKVA